EARSWLRRAVEFPAEATAERLSAVLRVAIDFPDENVLWPAAEGHPAELGQLGAVGRADGESLHARHIRRALADVLARRGVALEADCNLEPSFYVEVLQRVLEIAPSARWALDRLKLTLGSQARWEELFRLYDEVIDATANDSERAGLLTEAAFA